MKKRIYQQRPAMGLLAGVVLAVGLGFSSSARATSVETVNQALYNELTTMGAVSISGTAVAPGDISAELALEFAGTTATSEYTSKILPAIKLVSAEFPTAADTILNGVLPLIPAPAFVSGTSTAPLTDFEKQLKAISKAVFDGAMLGTAEWNRDPAASPLSVSGQAQSVTQKIASASTAFLAQQLLPHASGTDTVSKQFATAFLSDVKGVITQTIASGIVGLSAADQWALTGGVVGAVVNAADSSTALVLSGTSANWFQSSGRATQGLVDRATLGTTAITALASAKITGLGETNLTNALLTGLGDQDSERVLYYLVKSNAASTYALTSAALQGKTDAATIAAYLNPVFADKTIGYPSDAIVTDIVRAAVASAADQTAVFNALVTGNAKLTGSTSLPISAAFADSTKIAMVVGAVASSATNAQTYVNQVIPMIGGTAAISGTVYAKDTVAQVAKNTAVINLAKAVSTKIAQVSGTSALSQLPTALSGVLSALQPTGSGASFKNLDAYKLDLANSIIAGVNSGSTSPTTAVNAAALAGELAAIRDSFNQVTVSGTGSVTFPTVTQTVSINSATPQLTATNSATFQPIGTAIQLPGTLVNGSQTTTVIKTSTNAAKTLVTYTLSLSASYAGSYTTGTSTREAFTAALIKGATGKAPAINEIAQVFAGGTGFGGGLVSGTAFLSNVYTAMGTATVGQLADKNAFAAGLAALNDSSSYVSGIATIAKNQILVTTGTLVSTANAKLLDLAKGLAGVKDTNGALALSGSSVGSGVGVAFAAIAVDPAVATQTLVGNQASFLNSLVTAYPTKAPNIASGIIGSVSGADNKGILLGGIVAKLGADVSDANLATAVAANTLGTTGDKVTFLQNLVQTAGPTAAGIQKATSAVASTVVTSGSSNSAANRTALASFIISGTTNAKVLTAIDKVVGGAAEALSLNGGANSDVAGLARDLAPDNVSTSTGNAVKFASSVTASVPGAAVEVATALSQVSPAVTATYGMTVANRTSVAANTVTSVGNYIKPFALSGTDVNTTPVAAVGKTFPAMTAAIAEGVISHMANTPSVLTDKAALIGGMVKALTAFNSFGYGAEAINNLATYSLSGTATSGNGFSAGAGFTSVSQRELLLSKVISAAGVGYGATNLVANKVTSALIKDGQIASISGLADFANALLKGTAGDSSTLNSNGATAVTEKVAAVTSNLDATIYGIAQAATSGTAPLLTGTASFGDFTKSLLVAYGTTDTSTVPTWGSPKTTGTTGTTTKTYTYTVVGTSKIVYDSTTKVSVANLNSIATGLAKYASANNLSVTSSDIVTALANTAATTGTTVFTWTLTGTGSAATAPGTLVTSLKAAATLGGSATQSGTASTASLLVPDTLKAGLAAAVVGVDQSHYLDIAKAMAGTYSLASISGTGNTANLGELANKITAVVGSTKSNDEIAAIASNVILGAQAKLAGLGAADFNAAVANIAAQVIKLNGATKLATYEIVGAVLQTAKFYSGFDLTALTTAISNRVTGATSAGGLGLVVPSGAISGASSAVDSGRDSFDVGPVTHHETSVTNG